MRNIKVAYLSVVFSCILHIVSAAAAAASDQKLRVGFYNSSCPRTESIVRQLVQKRFKIDPSVTAALLRMHFHDCFVRGCDASILIDSTRTTSAEKDAGPNLTVREFVLIDQIKQTLEATCPSTVSCADIITLATRDAVALAGGPNYSVPTGRRDGLISDLFEVDLPGPDQSVSDISQVFISKGLTNNDMVLLLGAHTVGVVHCVFIQDRLSDFQGTGKPDPSLDPALAARFLKTCGTQTMELRKDPTVFLDQNTSFIVDRQYYKEIRGKRGVMQIDQELASDRLSASLVSRLAANENVFRRLFTQAMIKMGGIGVHVGKNGEIRKNCRVFNPQSNMKKNLHK